MTRGLAALGDRNFRWFFLARAITMITGSMSSIALAFAVLAMQGIIPQLTRPETLQQANAMLSFVRSAVTIGGPVIAGILVTTAGPAWAMVVWSPSPH